MTDGSVAGGRSALDFPHKAESQTRKLLWRRGDIELWQDDTAELRSGRSRAGYFVGHPEGRVASFPELHDACLYFWRITGDGGSMTEAEQSRQPELKPPARAEATTIR